MLSKEEYFDAIRELYHIDSKELFESLRAAIPVDRLSELSEKDHLSFSEQAELTDLKYRLNRWRFHRDIEEKALHKFLRKELNEYEKANNL